MKTINLPKEIFIVLGLLLIVTVMLVPVAPMVIDFGLYTSCLLACFVLTISVMVQKPAEFLTFPVVLIFSVVFRLGLNVASTRMIIQNGSTDLNAAGDIIHAVASIVIGGDLVTGLLIFFILLIVNLVVINKGASRMAEVGARFTLDGVPGRQMAIDADLAAGSISHEEAKRARETLQTETSFYGSLDGAAKFIKGDATAGVVITLLNLFVGVSVAVFVQGHEFSTAFQGLATLTIGDGIANQIPAVLISVAGAILLSRSGAQSSLSDEFWAPVVRYKELAYLAALVALVSNFFPGVPHLLSIPLTLGVGWLAFKLWRREDDDTWDESAALDEEAQSAREAEEEVQDQRPSVVTLKLAYDLSHLLSASNAQLQSKIEGIKTYLHQKYGLFLAPISVTLDQELTHQSYTICIHGSKKGMGRIGGRTFALDGPPTDEEEPVFGLKGSWSAPAQDQWSDDQSLSEYEVIATHLLHVLEGQLSALLSLHDCKQMIKAHEQEAGLESALPEGVSFEDVFRVCKEMLDERMSIAPLAHIIEVIYLKKSQNQSKEALFEEVRRTFAHDVVDQMQQPDGQLYVVALSNPSTSTGGAAPEQELMSPNALSQFMSQLQELLQKGQIEDHVLLVERHLRKNIFQLLKSMQIDMHVLAFDDVPFAQPVSVSHQMTL